MTSILDNDKQSSFDVEPSLRLRLSADPLNSSLMKEHLIEDETCKSNLEAMETNKKNDFSLNSSSSNLKRKLIEEDERNVKEIEKEDSKEVNEDNLKEVKIDGKKEDISSSPKVDEKNILSKKEKDTYLKLLLLEEELDEELSKLRTELDAVPSKQTTMNYLHEYNNIKDAAQVVLGALATMREVTIASLHKEYNLPTADE
ncbi:uncharacterized protein LOC122501834 [Leptopilina heterotoma]|uniref:uncharacterized protein LOC122501834 n=1 Tax=Leptopilina heterotoma TaxID=63436 RepID=UPI001CA81040|nr:uncharacterized protein LOC122501834 [Leptopilina heterotoma]